MPTSHPLHHRLHSNPPSRSTRHHHFQLHRPPRRTLPRSRQPSAAPLPASHPRQRHSLRTPRPPTGSLTFCLLPLRSPYCARVGCRLRHLHRLEALPTTRDRKRTHRGGRRGLQTGDRSGMQRRTLTRGLRRAGGMVGSCRQSMEQKR